MSEEQKELSVACQSLGDWTRTHTCGELTGADNGAEVCLMGWVQYRRDHGGLIFVDLRDRFGLTQIVFSPEYAPEAHEQAGALRSEYVLAMKGKVRPRPEGMVNPNLKTREVEVVVSEWKLLNTSKTPPFQIEDRVEAGENLRLQWRYLDLRRPRMARNLALRSRTAMAIRNELASQGFLEVETPILTKSTPEGARDYLVPSRLNHGQFYALPQSPQQFKQFCMIAGLDRYFQIARCFRDEAPPRRPSAGIHAGRHRNELRRREAGHGHGRRPHDPRVQGSARRGHSRSVPAHDVGRGHVPLRCGQARHPFRP